MAKLPLGASAAVDVNVADFFVNSEVAIEFGLFDQQPCTWRARAMGERKEYGLARIVHRLAAPTGNSHHYEGDDSQLHGGKIRRRLPVWLLFDAGRNNGRRCVLVICQDTIISPNDVCKSLNDRFIKCSFSCCPPYIVLWFSTAGSCSMQGKEETAA